MPYTGKQQTILTHLIKQYGDAKGHDIFNKMRAKGELGEDSKDRMMRRAAKARREGRSTDE